MGLQLPPGIVKGTAASVLVSWITHSGEASHYVMRILKRPTAEIHMESSLPPTASTDLPAM